MEFPFVETLSKRLPWVRAHPLALGAPGFDHMPRGEDPAPNARGCARTQGEQYCKTKHFI